MKDYTKLEALCEMLIKDFTYIAKDENNAVYAYESKPIKNNKDWVGKGNIFKNFAKLDLLFDPAIFDCLSWEDEEPYEIKRAVDWSKVAVDTPILVKYDERGDWQKRHFAKFKGGEVYAWAGGHTSYTADNFLGLWKYAKLAEVE